MSKHWRPDEEFVRARFGPGRRRPLPEGGKAGLLLVAAACLGVAFGIYQAFAPRETISPGAEAGWKTGQAANPMLTTRR